MVHNIRRVASGGGSVAVWCALLCAAVAALPTSARAADSIWVKVGASGRLQYLPDSRGDHILDYSAVGYQGGTVPLPTFSNVVSPDRIVTVAPVAGDNLASIQAAINAVAAKPLNINGFRGVVQLTAGTFNVSNTINITTSGIILRGVGDGSSPASSTILKSTYTQPFVDPVTGDIHSQNMISVDSPNSRSTNTTHNIADKVVPVGSTSMKLDSTSGYAIGDTILISRPSPANWIHDIGMDTLTNPWTAGSKNQSYERTITYIDQTNGRIFFDAPLPNSFELQYGGGTVQKYTFNRTQNVGIESIRGDGQAVLTTSTDESHSASFAVMQDTANAWVTNVTGQHLIYATAEVGTNSRNITVDDAVSINPVSIVTGGRRYPFNIEGAFSLMKNLSSDDGRHEFINNSPSRGPNVFLDGVATNGHADSGTHQRWSTGTLFDNLTTNTSIDSENRGNSGTGHGWAGANMVIWNSTAGHYSLQSPPTAQSWLIGSKGTIDSSSNPGYYDGSGTSATKVTSNGETSLYRAQLAQKVANPRDQVREYWLGDFDNYVNDGASDTVPVDPTWATAVATAFPSPTTNGFDGSLSASNIKVPFTFNFDAPGPGRVKSATLTMAVHAGGATPTNDSIYLQSTSNAINFSELGTLQHFENSDIVSLEFLASDARKNLSFLENGQLNLLVNDDHTVDWADLKFTVAGKDLNWTGATNSTWDNAVTQNWHDGVAADKFYTGDYLSFGNGPTNRNVSISGTVNPGNVIVNNNTSNNYTIGGGVIGGTTGLTKMGAGLLTLTGANTYLGRTAIQAGTVKVNNFAALGALTGDLVVISSGGALDVGGFAAENGTGGFGAKQFFIAGNGPDGTGAIVNTGLRQNNAFQFIGLTADASVGGSGTSGSEPGRFDIRGGIPILDLSGFTLTKKGASQFSLVGATVTDGNIVAEQGTFSIETSTNIPAGAGNITYKANTIAQFFNNTGTVARAMVIEGEGVQMGNGGTTSATIGSPITLKGNLVLTNLRGASNGILNLTGNIGESGGARSLTRNATGSGSIVILSGDNSYSGGTTVNAGELRLGSSTALGSTAGPLTVNGGTLNLNGRSATVGALGGSGGTINNAVSTPVTFTAGQGGASSNYSGVIQDGSGVVNFTKTGAGTLALFGIDTYTGVTNVNQGMLLVNGSHSGGGLYTVASGAALGGTGSITASIEMDGTLAPGASIESLGVTGDLGFGGTSVLQIELNGSSGAVDLLSITGSLNIDSGALVQFLVTGTPTANQYLFGTYTGALSGAFTSTSVPSGYQLLQGGGQLRLVSIPEPSTIWLSAVGTLGLMIFCRRRLKHDPRQLP